MPHLCAIVELVSMIKLVSFIKMSLKIIVSKVKKVLLY